MSYMSAWHFMLALLTSIRVLCITVENNHEMLALLTSLQLLETYLTIRPKHLVHSITSRRRKSQKLDLTHKIVVSPGNSSA